MLKIIKTKDITFDLENKNTISKKNVNFKN